MHSASRFEAAPTNVALMFAPRCEKPGPGTPLQPRSVQTLPVPTQLLCSKSSAVMRHPSCCHDGTSNLMQQTRTGERPGGGEAENSLGKQSTNAAPMRARQAALPCQK